MKHIISRSRAPTKQSLCAARFAVALILIYLAASLAGAWWAA